MRGGSIPAIVWFVVSIGKSSVPKTTNNRKLKKRQRKIGQNSCRGESSGRAHRREDFCVIRALSERLDKKH